MTTYLAALAVFLLTFLALAIGLFRGRHCLNCSCKAAERIMGPPKPGEEDFHGHHGPAEDGPDSELKLLD